MKKFTVAVIISGLLHGGLFAFAVVKIKEPKKVPLPPLRAMQVVLPKIPPASVGKSAPAPPPPVSVKQELPKPEVKKPTKPKSEKFPQKTKPSEQTKSPPKQSAPSSPIGISGAGAGDASGVSGLEAPDFEFLWYLDAIQRKIAENWFKPSSAGATADAVIYFRIQRNGRLTDVSLKQSSGAVTFDHAAQRAVLGASPMPPLPKKFEESYLGVYFTFLRETKPR